MQRENQTEYRIDSPNQDKAFESPDYDDSLDEAFHTQNPRNSDAYNNIRPNRDSILQTNLSG